VWRLVLAVSSYVRLGPLRRPSQSNLYEEASVPLCLCGPWELNHVNQKKHVNPTFEAPRLRT